MPNPVLTTRTTPQLSVTLLPGPTKEGFLFLNESAIPSGHFPSAMQIILGGVKSFQLCQTQPNVGRKRPVKGGADALVDALGSFIGPTDCRPHLLPLPTPPSSQNMWSTVILLRHCDLVPVCKPAFRTVYFAISALIWTAVLVIKRVVWA